MFVVAACMLTTAVTINAQQFEVAFDHSSAASTWASDTIISDEEFTEILLDFTIDATDGTLSMDASTDAENQAEFVSAISTWSNSDLGTIADSRFHGMHFQLIGRIAGSSNPHKFSLIRNPIGLAAPSNSNVTNDDRRFDWDEKMVWTLNTTDPIRLELLEWSYTNHTSGSSLSVSDNNTDPIDLTGLTGAEVVRTYTMATPEDFDLTQQDWIQFRKPNNAVAGVALSGMKFRISHAHPSVVYRNGISMKTDRDDDYDRVIERLDHYMDLGIDLIRVTSNGDYFDNDKAYLRALEDPTKNYPFKVKLISNNSANGSADQLRDYLGNKSITTGVFDVWEPLLEDQMSYTLNQSLAKIRRHEHWDRVTSVVVPLGYSSEPKYPSDKLNPDGSTSKHYAFWCYSDHAKAHFRDTMEAKYAGQSPQQVWPGSPWSSWETVTVPNPGDETVEVWKDVVDWYRQSHLDFMYLAVRTLKKYTNKKPVIYIPGGAYNEAEYELAYTSKGLNAAGSVKTMKSIDSIFEVAINEGCDIQYTGLNRVGSREIVDAAIRKNFDGYIYGENAGNAAAGYNPHSLASITNEWGIDGIDFTWDTWIFGDGQNSYDVDENGNGVADLLEDPSPNEPYFTELKEGYAYIQDPQSPHPVDYNAVVGDLPEFIEAGDDESIWCNLGTGALYHLGYKTTRYDLATKVLVGSPEQAGGQLQGSTASINVFHPEWGFGQSQNVYVYVKYYNHGTGEIKLSYQSERGELIHPDRIVLDDTSSPGWKIKRFHISDAFFEGRIGGHDFRLSGVNTTEPIILNSVGLKRADTLQAVDFDAESDPTRVNFIRIMDDHVSYLKNNTWIRFEDINFSVDTNRLSVEVACPSSLIGGTIEVGIGSAASRANGGINMLVGQMAISSGLTADEATYTFETCTLNDVTGVHDLYLRFVGAEPSGNFFNLRSVAISSPGLDIGKELKLIDVADLESHHGNDDVVRFDEGADVISWIQNDSWIRIPFFNMGSGASKVKMNAASPAANGGTLSFSNYALDDGFASVGIDDSKFPGGWNIYEGHVYDVADMPQNRSTDLYLNFSGGGSFLYNLDTIEFIPDERWQIADINGATGGVFVHESTDHYTVGTASRDIWGSADTFRYVYRQHVGSTVTVTAKVSDFAAAHNWAKVGLMVREDLSPGARNAYACFTSQMGTARLQVRNTTGAGYGKNDLNTALATDAEQYIRLQRRGDEFRAFYSSDGIDWTEIGAPRTITGLSENAYIGIAICKGDTSAPAVQADVSQVAFDFETTWSERTLGDSNAAGSFTRIGNEGAITVNGAGGDHAASADSESHFAYRHIIDEDFRFTARVTGFALNGGAGRAGIMVRSVLDQRSPLVMTAVNQQGAFEFLEKFHYNSDAPSVMANGSAASGDHWVRLTRTKDTLSGFYTYDSYQSADGVNWTLIDSQRMDKIPDSAYVGCFVASGNSTTLESATFEEIQIERY
ncbi:Unannotated [Lentimonas sp. CC4]|nr:Unannotated [Lentimonas sp. CC4]CAA6686368.1 Unannotated [Lentimonas sp. CC6]CAA7076142.1 Unannotated [Lentimonas sp. CC4]CAA7170865.1 Unannotated [Lentimonas sp. CC21]CAA7181193.1 Unannotated [Lentimonas sp. CC8]